MPSSRATTPPRRGRWRVRHIALAALGAAALLVVAVSGIGGSYALWNDSVTVDAGTITTGTAELNAAWADGHADAAWSNLLPGESVRQEFTLDNTGSAALELSATASTASSGFEVRAAIGTCPTTPLAGDPADGTSRVLLAAGGGAVVLPGSTSTVGCLEVRATAAATPDDHVEFVVQFDGMQVVS